MVLDLEFFLDEQINKLKIEIEKGCEEFEKLREKDVILLLMAEEWSSIKRGTVDDLWIHIKQRTFSNKGIDVILHSPGGDADAAYHLSTILNDVAADKSLSFVVPRLAKSAATLLACSGDSIVMTSISELGPIDPQVATRTGRWISVTTVRDALNEIFEMLESRQRLSDKCLDALFRTLPITEVGQFRKLIDYARDLLSRVLQRRMIRSGEGEKDTEGKKNKICEKLTEGYKYHGIPITRDEAKDIGLKIEFLPEPAEKILIEKIYIPFKEMVKMSEEILTPIISALPQPIISAKKVDTKFGLIYLPSIELHEKFSPRKE
ncbi:MAG: hypothetical protein QXY75_04370 [Candidatus Bathyarchaeia archaeon]